jgi:hypothetical protein
VNEALILDCWIENIYYSHICIKVPSQNFYVALKEVMHALLSHMCYPFFHHFHPWFGHPNSQQYRISDLLVLQTCTPFYYCQTLHC